MARFTNGWIKVHRKAWDSDLSGNALLWAIWLALLSMATWKESKVLFGGSQRVLPAGSVVFGVKELSDRWGISRSVIQKWLHYLHDTGRIVLTASSRGTVVTIQNWTAYQGAVPEEIEPRVNSEFTASSLRVNCEALIEEDKKERREEGGVGETKSALTPDGLLACKETWKKTLRYFGGSRDLLPAEESAIARAIQRYGDSRAVALALVGPREQPKDDKFDPGKYLNLDKVLSKEKFNWFLNLGSQWLAKREGRAS